jgi:hypothetical protein
MAANLDLVRSINTAWERGDFSSTEWADAEIEVVSVGGPSPGVWTGPPGMATAMRELLGGWQDFRIHPEEYRELDGERVLVLGHYSGQGTTSGVQIGEIGGMGAMAALLFHVSHGRVTRLVVFMDEAGKRAAAALASEGDST